MRKIKLNNNHYVFIDNEDYSLVSGYRWHLIHPKRKCSYAGTLIGKKVILMHRLILNAKKGQLVDHVNHNGLDNRRKNIRLCNPKQNCMNRSKRGKDNGTIYKGIYKGYKCWRACIRIHGKTIHLGSHQTPEKAALAYNSKAKKLFGKFAYINIIKP